jgi:hypothetical protein
MHSHEPPITEYIATDSQIEYSSAINSLLPISQISIDNWPASRPDM